MPTILSAFCGSLTTMRIFPHGSRALRRRHCVGGGAPVNFGRRRRAPGPKSRRRRGVGGQKINFVSKVPENISCYHQNFLMTFFAIDRKLQQNK